MKKILILIMVLSSFAGYSQTVGQFRYDTTKFLKVGGRNHVMIENLITTTDSIPKPLVVGADGFIKKSSAWFGTGSGGSGSIEYILQGFGIKVDSTGRLYTVSVDTAEINNLISGDTTIFETVLDSTGQPNNRILFSRNQKVSSSPRLLIDSANSRVIINGANVSVGGPNTKLWVGGNTTITGQAIIQTVPQTIDTTTYKPLVIGADGIVRKNIRWPATGGTGGGVDTLFYNIDDFGAVGDGVADDRPALVLAIAAANNAGGGVVYLPRKYYISDSVLLTKSIRFMGAMNSGGLNNDISGLLKDRFYPQQRASVIYSGTNKSVFVIDTAADGGKPTLGVQFLTFIGDTLGTATAGSFIRIKGNLQAVDIADNTFYGGYTQVDFQAAFYAKVVHNHFSAPTYRCLILDNLIRGDTGDGLVEGNTFSSGNFATSTAIAIEWLGGGGRRISNNKFDASSFVKANQFMYCIKGDNVHEATSVMQFSNLSMENFQTAAIKINASFALDMLIISNVQIAGYGATSNVIDITGVDNAIVSDYTINGSLSTDVPAIKLTSCVNPVVGVGIVNGYTDVYSFVSCTNAKAYNGNGLVVGPYVADNSYNHITLNGLNTTNNYNILSSIADPNLYINAPSTKSIVFKEGGTTRMVISSGGTVGINQPAPEATSILDIVSTTKGFLSPRMTTTERDAISFPANGLSIYNTTTFLQNWYDLTAGRWQSPLNISQSVAGALTYSLTNSNTGASAITRLLLGNNTANASALDFYGGGTATPNITIFQAGKDFVIGTDNGVASGGTSSLVFATGGYNNYSVAAGQVIINGSGAVRFSAYGAGTLTTDASGNVTATSDIRLKSNIKDFNAGLKEVLKLQPITYSWNGKSGNETKGTYAGFSAQNVKEFIPYGTGEMPDGTLTLQDRAIMAAMVNAIKELKELNDKQQKQIDALLKKAH